MDSHHLVDPELRLLLEVFPTVHPLTTESIPRLRSLELPPWDGRADGVTRTFHKTPDSSRGPRVDLHVFRPTSELSQLPCIYHIHGGGFVSGSPRLFEPIHRRLCIQHQCVVVAVEYRLAPETVFPGAIEDCYAGLAWISRNADALGIDFSRIGVLGESAGGGLAAALALLARDRGEYALAFQHLIYPMLDDRTCIAEPHPFAGEFVWTRQANHFGWAALLGSEPGGAGVSPYAAPARAADLSGLPPTFLSTGALDLFVEEDLEFGRRLMRAGVPTELHVYPGAFHGFDATIAPEPAATVAKSAHRDSSEALARALRPAKQG